MVIEAIWITLLRLYSIEALFGRYMGQVKRYNIMVDRLQLLERKIGRDNTYLVNIDTTWTENR